MTHDRTARLNSFPRTARRSRLAAAALAALTLASCSKKTLSDAERLRSVALGETNDLACLKAPVEVLFTAAGEPHIYGESEHDVACALGFVVARDRFFEMEMASRLALGRLSEIFGDFAIATDIENRTLGMRAAAERLLAGASPAWRAKIDAYAAGVNEYVQRARDGSLPLPSEYDFTLLRALGGFSSGIDMLDDWDALKVAAMGVVVIYEAGFGTDELGYDAGLRQAESWGLDLPLSDLRRAGLQHDIIASIEPLYPVNSSIGWVPGAPAAAPAPRRPRVESGVLARALETGEAWQKRHKRPADEPGIGSNAWAVAPSITADGQTLLAGDGHLSLTVPAFFYLAHVDTKVLGKGNLHFMGLALPGVPLMGPGTNGRIAWTQTVLNGDGLDWYAEDVVLDADGRPKALRFQGAEQPLAAIEESYRLPGGRTETIARYETAGGRMLYSLEGEVLDGPDDDGKAVNVNGRWIVAGDVDEDGVVSAVSMVIGAQFERHLFDNLGAVAYAQTVEEVAALHRNVVNYSAILTVADADGGIMTSGWVAVPCRSYLPRDAEGVPLPGANPQRLLDGTLYPSWQVRVRDDGSIDTAADDELSCILPPERYPIGLNPAQGYVLNANNEIHDNNFDRNLWNDTYLGGPWDVAFRAKRIDDVLSEGAGGHDLETMVALQADHYSNVAAEFLGDFLDAVERVAALPADAADSKGRQRALWSNHRARIDDAAARLRGWQARGLHAASGVDTFYDAPTDIDRLDAIATSIWNAWLAKAVNGLFVDEAIPGGAWPGSSRARQLKLLRDFLDGVGAGNPGKLASWNPDTLEPVFWDDATTPEVELRDEILIRGLVQALDLLAAPAGPDMRSGGFGSDNPADWLWGLKHFVRFESILAMAVSGDMASIFEPFGITTKTLPLRGEERVTGLAGRLKGFPRPGDQFAVDAANFGFGEDFSYGSGPVMRMAISIGAKGVSGYNVVPGGQSGLNDSPHYADQAAMWLANEALPMHFTVDAVVKHAERREQLRPR